MSNPASQIEVRAARTADRDAIFALCAHTWPDGDYIPYVWDEWLADTEGALLVALAGAQPVGLVHLRRMSPDEGWIEGIRVDPDARRLGIGRVLVSRALAAAHERGATVVRLITGVDNHAAQGLCAHFGFTRVAEVRRYHYTVPDEETETLAEVSTDGGTPASGPADGQERSPSTSETSFLVGGNDAAPEGARIVSPGEEAFERIWEWLVQSNLAPLTGGLEFDRWSARVLAEPFLRAELAAGRVFVLEEWETILALAIIREFTGRKDAQSSLEVRYLDGHSEGIGRLALFLREVAAERGLRQVILWLPDLLILRDAMDGAGFGGDLNPMWVYAREL